MLGIVDTFRESRSRSTPSSTSAPASRRAVGTRGSRRSTSTRTSSSAIRQAVLDDLHAQNVKVVVHMVPWDRDRLPDAARDDSAATRRDAGRVAHRELLEAARAAGQRGHRRLVAGRRRLVQSVSSASSGISSTTRALFQTTPNVRPWSLQRNGHPGIAQWGGWVWSGDTDSSWKTLEAQIAVGINHSLSIGPVLGFRHRRLLPNNELTGELYARWFQFAAFCGSFRSHGRIWWPRLPWGWGLSDMGPREHNNTNARSRQTTGATPAVGDEQPGDRADREEIRRAALPADSVHLHAGGRGARHAACR